MRVVALWCGAGAPKVVAAVGVVEAELGGRAELHCHASGVPLPNPMEWSFNGRYYIYCTFEEFVIQGKGPPSNLFISIFEL